MPNTKKPATGQRDVDGADAVLEHPAGRHHRHHRRFALLHRDLPHRHRRRPRQPQRLLPVQALRGREGRARGHAQRRHQPALQGQGVVRHDLCQPRFWRAVR